MAFRNVAVCCVFLFLLTACTSPAGAPGDGAGIGGAGAAEGQGEKTTGAGDVRIGSPVAHGNLTVFALYLSSHEDVKEDFITLEQALGKKQVQVKEQGSGGTVNSVEIENGGERPLYILAGQVIVGGKQDRVITQDTIVPPGQKIQVEVCCVEHGRWSPRQGRGPGFQDFTAALSANTQSNIRQLAQAKGKEAQGEVWKEVDEAGVRLQAQSATQTYKQVVEKTEKNVNEFFAAFKSFEKDVKICGFVACINGEVETCDLFASPKLLALFRESLLRGYALDALNAPEAKDAKEATAALVKSFLDEMEAAKKNAEKLAEDKHRRVEKTESERVIGFYNRLRTAEPSERALHENTYYKRK